jgi:hypothetical protein
MKKLFFGLLIVAAGTGAFFLLQEKNKTSNNDGIQRDLIIGKWKLNALEPGNDSSQAAMVAFVMALDSNLTKYQYEFNRQGSLLLSFGDSLSGDSSRYEWDKEHQLVVKDSRTDSIADILKVALLNKDSLRLVDKDSSSLLFTRLR